MNNKFDELTKQMAQSVTRRAALKKFGVGLAGMALACLGLANRAEAGGKAGYCQVVINNYSGNALSGWCVDCKGISLYSPQQCPFGTPASVKKVCVPNVTISQISLSSIQCRM